jgi:hypothetical protein
MFYLKDMVSLLSLKDQLPGYSVVATDDFIGIDGIDYRINCYGWPNNRITVEDKITGLNSIKSFGPKGTEKAKAHYRETLERFGVDTCALDLSTAS